MSKLSPEMQKAAVVVALNAGYDLEQIEENYPDLKEGVALIVEARERQQAPNPVRIGSMHIPRVRARRI